MRSPSLDDPHHADFFDRNVLFGDRPNRDGERIPVGRRLLSTADTLIDLVSDPVSRIVDPGPLWHHPTPLWHHATPVVSTADICHWKRRSNPLGVNP
jgi:hypothetical protein